MRGVVGWDVRDGSWRSAGQRSYVRKKGEWSIGCLL